MIDETRPRVLPHMRGLDPEKYAAIEAECEAREQQRRARAAPSEVVPPSPGPAPSETAREYAAAVAEGFRALASRLRELAAASEPKAP
jgi:hypothetical protein